MSERTKVTDWPEVRTTVHPYAKARLEALHDRTGTSVAELIRQAVNEVYLPKPLWASLRDSALDQAPESL